MSLHKWRPKVKALTMLENLNKPEEEEDLDESELETVPSTVVPYT